MSGPSYPRVASLKTADAFRTHLEACGAAIAFDESLAPSAESPLARPFELDGVRVGNRFCILPMEGWDGTADGNPTELTTRRWERFGISGAKLIWGGEAVAVQHDGRANPNQLLLTAATQGAIAGLREALVRAHRAGPGCLQSALQERARDFLDALSSGEKSLVLERNLLKAVSVP